MNVEGQGGCQGSNEFAYFCHHECNQHVGLEILSLIPLFHLTLRLSQIAQCP